MAEDTADAQLIWESYYSSNLHCSRWHVTGQANSYRPATFECLTSGGFDLFIADQLTNQQIAQIKILAKACPAGWSFEQGPAGLGDFDYACIGDATKPMSTPSGFWWALAGIAGVLGATAFISIAWGPRRSR